MGQTIPVVKGNDWGPLAATLLDASGTPINYPSNATLSATVSRGGDEASLFSPTVAWVSSTAGTVAMSGAGSQTAALDEGVYLLQIFATTGGLTRPVFDGQLEILPTVGTVTPPLTWCSEADMEIYYDQLETLRNNANDTTGFLRERGRATGLRARLIALRYEPRPGKTRTRQSQPDPILQTTDVPTPNATIPDRADVTTAMATPGGIVLEDRLREIIALDSLAIVLRRQVTTSRDRNYQAVADEMTKMADARFGTYQAQIVTASPIGGVSNFLIGRDCIILPAGTAP